MPSHDISRELNDFDSHVRCGRYDQAVALCREIVQQLPDKLDADILVSQLWQQLGDFDAMLHAATRAVERESALGVACGSALLRLIECEIYCNRIDMALQRLDKAEAHSAGNANLLQKIANLYLHCADHRAAARCYQLVAALEPNRPHHLFNHAAALVITGDLHQAEQLLDRVLTIDPNHVDALQNRSMLKTWKFDNNHLEQLNRIERALPENHPSRVPVYFALAKEYEDIGDYRKSFAALDLGSRLKRQRMAYRVENDVMTMEHIQRTFHADRLQAVQRTDQPEPAMFVMGLPRSGTTLVDRILSSHSAVSSLGEIQGFTFALMQLAGGGPGGKPGLIDRAAEIDMQRLGNLYRQGIRGYGAQSGHLINKTPANYLYLGLIHMALPDATIVHVRRHPMDSCYAMYKTLFAMGYPFSYSLEDIGHYYIAYHRLMEHWRTCMPGRFIDIDYESVVEYQEETTRALLAWCSLPWEQDCLEFHLNDAPAASASAAQVRNPLYKTSVQRWRNYEAELLPLADMLTQHGIACD